MSRKVFFGQNDIRYYYNRYKDSKYYSVSVFLLVIIVCIVLLLGVIIPQFITYLSIRQEITAKQEQITIMNNNMAFINNLDKSALSRQLETATNALPAGKDFAGLLNAISDASIRSGVTLSDFNFSVGDISSKSAKNANSPELLGAPQSQTVLNTESVASAINLTVSINGDTERVKLFLKQLNEKIPLSEVTGIDKNDNTSVIVMEFYYKSYPEILFKEDVTLVPISIEKAKLIDMLASWKTSGSEEGVFVPVGTNSATPLFE